MSVDRHECAYLGLGSNLGDRLQFLRHGADELHRLGVAVRRASSVYASAYVGPGAAQPPYLNAVLEVVTPWEPLALLDVTQEVERRMGRAPDTHLQPRVLDVDLLFQGERRCDTQRLTLPHPRLAERRFVLEPLDELGVLERVPLPGLQERLLELRRVQDVELWAAWPRCGEGHGSRV